MYVMLCNMIRTMDAFMLKHHFNVAAGNGGANYHKCILPGV